MDEFIESPDGRWKISRVHVQGSARAHCLTATAFTPLGEEIASNIPVDLPERAPVLNERERIRAPSPLTALRTVAEVARRFNLHCLCILSFEAAHILEDMPLPKDAFFQFLIAECEATHQGLQKQGKDLDFPQLQLLNNSSANFFANFVKAREHLLCGDIFEIVLSRKFDFSVEHNELFNYLKQKLAVQKAQYCFALKFPETSIVGASPELLIEVKESVVINRPISGSIRRTAIGTDEFNREEREQWSMLMHSEKEKSELDMLIDLARHDLHRVCNNVTVTNYREALLLETVAHTQATVSGNLKQGYTAIDALLSCLNAGTLVGAPKKKAMEIIACLETEPRGYYGGNLVHIEPSGHLRSTVLIRSCIIQGNMASVQAGATVLLDSNAEYEYWECGAKARNILSLLKNEDLCYLNSTPPAIVNFEKVSEPLKFAQAGFFKDHLKFPSFRLLLIDNEDSFTFNLAALFESFGCYVDIVRNNIEPKNLSDFHGLILSPGPASPSEAGFLLEYVKQSAGKLPVFGVCLGFQAMVQALGGTLAKMKIPLHGKSRNVHLVSPNVLTANLPNTFLAARYHSLRAERIPTSLTLLAEDDNQIPLALSGPAHWPPFLGLQFHPESFLTGNAGSQLCVNWLSAIIKPKGPL